MMGLVYPWICIQARIDHDPVDEVIHHGGDAVHTAEPVLEAGRILSGHRYILLLPPVGVRTVLVLPSAFSHGGARRPATSMAGPPC